MTKQNKKAFTLAEVLITLGIIGVVAAMTMPTLIQNHQKQVYATSAKKAVNIVQNMFKQILADEDVSDFYNASIYANGVCQTGQTCEDAYGNPSVLENIIPKYLKVVKTCSGSECDIKYARISHLVCDTNDKCKLSVPSNSATVSEAEFTPVRAFYTTDGMIFYFTYVNNGIRLTFDTNAEKGPNVHGRDMFIAVIDKNGKFWPNIYAENVMPNNLILPLKHMMENGWKMDY